MSDTAEDSKAGLQTFLNRIKRLNFVETEDVPNLTESQKERLLSDPVRFFIRAEDAQQAAIWEKIR
jgi:hypothetical protein